jgi:hypothetical protein
LYDLAQATRLVNEHLRPLAHSHSFAITVYKLHGISLDSIVLVNLYESTKGNRTASRVRRSVASAFEGWPVPIMRTFATDPPLFQPK